MKQGWTYKKLGECIDKIPKQKQVKSKDYKTSGLYPIVSQEKDLISGYWDDETFLFKHKKPIIIFGDHTKEIKYIDFDFVVGADGTQILSPKDDIDSKFFYYTLLATPLRTLGYARHFKLLKEKLFKIPSLSEQSRIVSRLDAAFGEIEGLKAKAEAQLNEARALFQSALTEAMKPKQGWEERTLGEMGDFKNGMNYLHNESGYDIRILGVGDFGNRYSINNPCELSMISLNKIPPKDYLLNDEDVVFVRSNGNKQLVGRAIIVYTKGEPITFSGFCIRYRKKNERLNINYLLYFLKTKEIREKLFGNGANISNLNQKLLQGLNVYYPSLEIQQAIVSRLDALSEKVRELEETQKKVIAECDALKQALLREVFE